MAIELLEMALLILVAKMLEEVTVRKGFPPLIGWTLAGMLLGPALLSIVTLSPELLFLADIGVYLFFFMIGLDEIDLKGVVSSLNVKCIIAQVLSTIAVMFSAYLVGLHLGLSELESISLSVLVSLPTASVVAKSLSDTNMLKTSAGTMTFSYVLIGEVMVLLIVSALFELEGLERLTLEYILLQASQVALFFILIWLANIHIIPRLIKAIKSHMTSKEAQIGIVFALIFLFVGLSEILGLHGVIGALALGLALSSMFLEESSGHALEALKKIGNGILIPLLFASVGLRFGWDFMYQDLFTLAVLALLLIPYRTIAHYLVLKIFRVRHAKHISTSMLARGGIDMVVLVALFQRNFIGTTVHSLTMAASVASLLIYSLIIRRLFKGTIF